MATTNIHLAKNMDFSPLEHHQIKVGLAVKYPSGAGGFITGVCERLTDEVAEFISTNKSWPNNLVVKFNQPDLTDEEFVFLLEVLRKMRSPTAVITSDENLVIVRAIELGYVSSISHCQRSMTEKSFQRIELLQSL